MAFASDEADSKGVSLDVTIRNAIHNGDKDLVKEIIESGRRAVNDADDEGCYMLQWAALSNQSGIMRSRDSGMSISLIFFVCLARQGRTHRSIARSTCFTFFATAS